MTNQRLRILHLSDLHIGKEKPENAYRVERVMGDAWDRNLIEIRKDGQIDLVCFTGDLAQSGRADQYHRLKDVIRNVQARVDCPLQRFFCVPGNHDIDRGIEKNVWRKLRPALANAPHAFSDWFAENPPLVPPATGRKKPKSRAPTGFKDAARDALLARQQAYRDFLVETGLAHLLPGQAGNPHPRLGYRHTLDLGLGAPLHIIGFDSAWLAGDDNDASKLHLTEDQIGRLMTHGGKRLPGWSIGLIHHPPGDLADGDRARQLMADYGLGLLLHGHQHTGRIETWADPQRRLSVFAAGCLYESHHYPNGLSLIEIELPENAPLRPLRVQTRAWSANGHWHNHDGLYRDSRNGWLVLDPEPAVSFTPTPGKFIGRDDERDALCAALLPAARGEDTRPTVICCAIAGMPGVGKTRLAEEFVAGEWREALGVPPGTSQTDLCARLVLAPDDHRDAQDLAAAVLSAYGRNASADRVIGELRALLLSGPGGRRLLLVENIDGPRQASTVATLAAQLPGCAVLGTARYRDLGDHWRQVPVQPLPRDQAIALLRNRMALGRNPHPLKDDEAVALVERLGRLPLALHIAGSHLGRGVSPQSFERQLEEKQLALGPVGVAGDAANDSGAARSVIATAFAISWELWSRTVDPAWKSALVALAHGPVEGVGDALGAAMTELDLADYETCTLDADGLSLLDLEFVEDEDKSRRRVRLHPLIAEFLRLQLVPEEATIMARISAWCDPLLREEDGEVMPSAWVALRAESPALLHWLAKAPQPPSAVAVGIGTVLYALSNGPYVNWLSACSRWAEGCEDVDMLGTLRLAESRLLGRLGDPVRSERAARLALSAFQKTGNERDVAIAYGQIADILQSRGELEEALQIRREKEIPVYERLNDFRLFAVTQGRIADILQLRGDWEEVLRIRREEEILVYERLGDVRSRAVTQGKIAATLRARGDLEEALRILHEEVLPVRKRFGDIRGCAFTQGNIAAILEARGELEEALRIRREEQMPVYERLGDVRERAVTHGQIADILEARGDSEEALRIWREEALPVYECLGDVRACAIAHSRIADILEARDDLENAMRIVLDDVLPVYERLGDVRSLLVTRANLALTLHKRGHVEDSQEIHTLLQQALADAERLRLPEAETIRGRIAQIFGPGDESVAPP